MRIAFAAAWSIGALGSAQAQEARCNRTCLEGMISTYITALAAHDPGRLPVAPGVKYAENDQVLPLGTGEWQVAGQPGRYRHIFSDPQSGQVAAITTLTEHGVALIYVVRLKVAHGKISEIETQITRDALGAARYEKMGHPEHVWLEAVPPALRIPRATLIAQANKYYSGMERNDPKGDYSFFDKDCNRLEDAVQTTNLKVRQAYGHSHDTDFSSLGCEAQFQTGFLGFVTKIRERRYLVDEERQAVIAFTTFDHNGTVRTLPSVNGKSSPIPAYFDVPRTLHASEAFRLRGDKLFRIEMTLTEVPYGMSSPFHAGPPVNLTGAGTNRTAPRPCNRACLENLVEQVLQAMLAHDPSRLPLAKGVRYSENGQFIALGDGLWGTAGKIAMPISTDKTAGDYAVLLADPARGTAGYWGRTNEHGTPGVLALRIKVVAGKISEIEAIDVREESQGPRGGTMTLMRPPLPVELQIAALGSLDPVFQQQKGDVSGDPRNLITAYFDGLERHSSNGVRFSPRCTRRDNAVQGSLGCAAQMDGQGPSPDGLFKYTTSVRDRRILLTDAERGVVMAVAMVDNPGTAAGNLPASQLVPSTYMVPQLIKIDGESISRVEGLVKWMPFGYTSAWSQATLRGSESIPTSIR
ncbi:MAG TPA: hypothetical protein VME17_18940 [Bryobacteraceae bacterium]|nr:hypothetical protein [Bryobacteraceae bacterium]